MASGPQHRKHDSRNSRSLLSVELWRSIGRGRSRPVSLNASNSDLDLRAAANLSCNPYEHQPLPSSNDVDPAPCSYPASSGTSLSESFRNLHSRRAARTSEIRSGGPLQRARLRPLSWVSFGRDKTQKVGAKRPSMPLPHQNSMSSVAKSSISSPMLTSTTNARVADNENIECSDVLLPDYSSQRAASHRSARAQRNVSQHSHKFSDKHLAWATTVRSVKKKLSHTRRASTSLLLERPWVRWAGEKIGHSTTSSTAPSRAFGKSATNNNRMRQYREDDQQARLNSDSTSILQGNTSETPEPAVASHTVLRNPQAPRLPGLHSDSTTDLNATSLSRSFASAVDKLDFQSSRTLVLDGTPMSRLKKAKSYFSLRNASRENSVRNLENGDSISKSSSWNLAAEAVKQKQVSTLTAFGRSKNKEAPQPKIAASQPAPLRFSGVKNRCIKAKPDPAAPHGANPLKMHPEVTAFARPPPRSCLPVNFGPPLANDNNNNNDDHDQAGSIDSAIIYSPETDTLSEYSRHTPSPELPKRRDRVPQETPTRKPLRRIPGSMLKKSVSTFFGRSASVIKLSSFTPSRRSKTEHDLGRREKRSSWHTGTSSVQAKGMPARARSLSTPDMYGPNGMRAAWDYQPSTPSPLRKSTKLSTTSTGRRRAVTTTTLVRLPAGGLVLQGQRSASVLSDPEKRYVR